MNFFEFPQCYCRDVSAPAVKHEPTLRPAKGNDLTESKRESRGKHREPQAEEVSQEQPREELRSKKRCCLPLDVCSPVAACPPPPEETPWHEESPQQQEFMWVAAIICNISLPNEPTVTSAVGDGAQPSLLYSAPKAAVLALLSCDSSQSMQMKQEVTSLNQESLWWCCLREPRGGFPDIETLTLCIMQRREPKGRRGGADEVWRSRKLPNTTAVTQR